MTNEAAFWDGIAARYAKSPIRDMDAYEYTLGRTRSHLGGDDSVLELGCGTGSTALLLADGVRRIVASDLSPKMIEIGREKARQKGTSNVEFVVADVSDPKLAGTPFDAVLALNLLHLIPDLPRALADIHGLIRPGGLFISKSVCRPDRALPLKLRLMTWALPILQMLGKAPYVNLMRISELEAQVTAAGFEIIESGNHPVMPPSRYIVARRL